MERWQLAWRRRSPPLLALLLLLHGVAATSASCPFNTTSILSRCRAASMLARAGFVSSSSRKPPHPLHTRQGRPPAGQQPVATHGQQAIVSQPRATPPPPAGASHLVAALLGNNTPMLLTASGASYSGFANASGIVYLSAPGCVHHMKVCADPLLP